MRDRAGLVPFTSLDGAASGPVRASGEMVRFRTLVAEAYPRHAAKEFARASGAPLGSAKHYVEGRREPPASLLLRAAARCDRFNRALDRLIEDLRSRGAACVADHVAPDRRPDPEPAAAPRSPLSK